MSLKDELLGAATPAPVPPYRLAFPEGWEQFTPDGKTERDLVGVAGARLRDAHRPDLKAQLDRMTRSAFEQMRKNDTVAFYMQRGVPEEQVLPLSITATRITAEHGQTLDARVGDLIRRSGATALNDDKLVLRWESASSALIEGQRVASRTVSYLTPIPGSGRRQALQFTAVVPHPPGVQSTDTPLRELLALCDMIMGTFTWLR